MNTILKRLQSKCQGKSAYQNVPHGNPTFARPDQKAIKATLKPDHIFFCALNIPAALKFPQRAPQTNSKRPGARQVGIPSSRIAATKNAAPLFKNHKYLLGYHHTSKPPEKVNLFLRGRGGEEKRGRREEEKRKTGRALCM
jgi:hypothetical protein